MASAIVRIWWFTWRGAHMLGGGHGSLQLPAPYNTYITWLDGDARDQIINNNWDLVDDKVNFQHCGEPIAVELPLRDRSHHCGLDPENICLWWTLRKTQAPEYKLLSKSYNCDATVVAALCAGGADFFIPAPSNLIYQGASTLLNWVRNLKQRLNELQGVNNRALRVLLAASNEPWQFNLMREDRPEIWTLAPWKAASNVAMGTRKEQVLSIDKLLPEYHALSPNNETGRYDLAYEILAHVVDHLVKKPQSKRRGAVVKLGRQVYDKLRELEDLPAPVSHPTDPAMA